MELKFNHFSLYLIILLIIFIHLFYYTEYHCNSFGQFQFKSESKCYSYLNCRDVKHMNPIQLLAKGVVKNIWIVEWNYHLITMSSLTNIDYLGDFNENIKNHYIFRSSSFVSKILGVCGNSIFTEYYQLGNMNNLQNVFKKYRIEKFNDRFKYCIQYVKIINFLHQHSMVMCDTNSLEKTLTQYLINDNLQIILNDMDALPVATDKNKILCGNRIISSDFVAPEQTKIIIQHNKTVILPYDHKTDIWKIPDICHWILANTSIPEFQRQILYWIHQKCKSKIPSKRPETKEILQFYNLINSL